MPSPPAPPPGPDALSAIFPDTLIEQEVSTERWIAIPEHEGLIEAVAVHQIETFETGGRFARAEGIIPAPESCHAIRAVIDDTLKCKESGETQTLFFNLSGHGHFDMASFYKYLAGELRNYEYPQQAIEEALAHLPRVDTPA